MRGDDEPWQVVRAAASRTTTPTPNPVSPPPPPGGAVSPFPSPLERDANQSRGDAGDGRGVSGSVRLKAAHNLCIAGFTGLRGGGERRRGGGGGEGATDVRFLEEKKKRPTQQRRGLDPLFFFFLNVTQHLFHIYDGGAASPMPPSTTAAILSQPRITPATRRCIIYKANLSRKRLGRGREGLGGEFSC